MRTAHQPRGRRAASPAAPAPLFRQTREFAGVVEHHFIGAPADVDAALREVFVTYPPQRFGTWLASLTPQRGGRVWAQVRCPLASRPL